MNQDALPPNKTAPMNLESLCARVAEDIQLLAILHDREPDGVLIKELQEMNFPSVLSLALDSGPGLESVALMEHALSTLPADIKQPDLDELAADYASIYLNHAIAASPEESVWLDEDSLMCQESMFQVRSWYASYGLGIPDWRLRPDDHLVYQLQFIAWLLSENESLKTIEDLATFMDEHLLRWLGNFAERVIARCETPYFAGVAAITAAYCEIFRDILADILEQPRPSREEVEQRMQLNKSERETESVRFMPGMGPVV